MSVLHIQWKISIRREDSGYSKTAANSLERNIIRKDIYLQNIELHKEFYLLYFTSCRWNKKSVSQSTIQPVSPRGYIPTISVLEIIFTTTGRTQQKDDDDEEVQGMCGSTSGVNKLIRNFSFSHPRRIFPPPTALGSNMCPIEGCMLLLLRLLAT